MTAQTPDLSRIKGSQFAMYFCGTLLLIYFLFPHLLLMPYVLVAGGTRPVPGWMDDLLWPVRTLPEHVPPYQALLQEESELTGIH